MNKTKSLTILAMLTAASLCVFVLEAQIPALVPSVPGIKLGLANIFTLFCFQILGALPALSLLLIRIFLGAFVTGQVSALGYALCGGFLSYLLLLLLHRFFPLSQLWALSAICAIGHNLGQILLAAYVLNSSAVFWYFPALLLAALVTGSFTGLTCQLVLVQLRKNRLWVKKVRR